MIKKGKSKPAIGDYIEHTCALNGRFEGKIVQMLAMQFVYKTSEGITRFCLFRESWNHIEKPKKKKK
jgi:hypothetical protein|tara:strand:- start:1795 stop:1995 length:201 start_codon:yes stop_codon:yes gene_type:complete